jgi:hypothetical protein
MKIVADNGTVFMNDSERRRHVIKIIHFIVSPTSDSMLRSNQRTGKDDSRPVTTFRNLLHEIASSAVMLVVY